MVPVATFLAALVIALLVRHLLLQLFIKRVQQRIIFSHVFLEAVRFPSVLWCVVAALQIAILTASPEPWAVAVATKSTAAFLIVSISLVFAAIVAKMIAVYSERKRIPVVGLSQTLTYVVILSIAAIMLIRLFGGEISGVLTALGVGGLAVALALQDTLANLFAGIHILLEEAIVVGDPIRLSTGEEGTVRDIGWRTTRILTGTNDTIVIPNTKITTGILTNFNLPDKRAVVDVAIVAGHDADPDVIAQIAMEAAASTEGALREPAPTVLFDPGITPTHMQMKLIVHVATPADKGPVQSEIRFRILQQFRSEGIPLPSVEKTVIVRN